MRTKPVNQDSATNYHNLRSFAVYGTVEAEKRKIFGLENPVCFWIDNIDFDEDHIKTLAKNLKFFLSLYDKKTPLILVHGHSN